MSNEQSWPMGMQLMKVYMAETSCNQMLTGSAHSLFDYTVYGALLHTTIEAMHM